MSWDAGAPAAWNQGPTLSLFGINAAEGSPLGQLFSFAQSLNQDPASVQVAAGNAGAVLGNAAGTATGIVATFGGSAIGSTGIAAGPAVGSAIGTAAQGVGQGVGSAATAAGPGVGTGAGAAIAGVGTGLGSAVGNAAPGLATGLGGLLGGSGTAIAAGVGIFLLFLLVVLLVKR